MKIKIYGLGWVGKAMRDLFPDALIHDPDQGYNCNEKCDVAFVCVPTPVVGDGLDTSIVGSVIKDAEEDLIIVRSTVNPGNCDMWEQAYKKNIVFMPEYLGESPAHPLLDETKRNFLIIGGKPENRRKAIELFWTVFNANTNIRQMSNLEAEVVKLSENRAIMFRVMEAQELFDACEKNGVDYYTVREAVYSDDPRMSLWWTAIYKERGANSKCIPKDVYAWYGWAKEPLTGALLQYNEELRAKCQNSQ